MTNRIVATAILIVAGHAASANTQPFDFALARDETVGLLQALIRIDTSSPPGNETRAAEHVQDVLSAADIPSRIFAVEPSRGNLVARLKGNGTKRPLLLMAHTDVVGVERTDWTWSVLQS